MQELRDLAQRDLIGNFVENPPFGLSIENVSGVSLRIDDYWLSWYVSLPRLASTSVPLPTYVLPTGLANQRFQRMFFDVRYNFDERPKDWIDHCNRKGYAWQTVPGVGGAHPVLVIVILRKPLKQIFPTGGDYPRNVGPHPIIYEHRPEAVGYLLTSGDFFGAAHEGTLGGFLWHKNDLTYYAVSCAHVLGDASSGTRRNRAYSPKPNVFGAKTEIGDVTWSQMPSSSTTKCNNRINPNAPTVDAAFAELDGTFTPDLAFPGVGKITQWTQIANMGQGDPTSFAGYISATVSARVKEATIWKEITLNGTPHCFSDIFVLEDTVFHYVASPLSQKGDSGAWVVNSTSGFISVVSWDGMLIGGDGQNAYCCYAENIMKACPDANIQLPP